MRSKTTDFYVALADSPYPLIALTETWLTMNILTSELFDARFVVYRRDRCLAATGVTRGGGVLFAVNSSFISRQIDLYDSSELIEQICVRIDFFRSIDNTYIKLYFFVSYIPPNSPVSIYSAHVSNIKHIANDLDCNSFLFVLGDFNLSHIKWSYSEDDKCLIAYNILKDFEIEVVDSLSVLNLVQINSIQNNLGRWLDLVFTHMELDAFVTEPDYYLLANRGIHHKALIVNFDISYINSNIVNNSLDKSFKYDFFKVDYNDVNNYLSVIDWNSVLGSGGLNQKYKMFRNVVDEVFSKFVPMKTCCNSGKPVWFHKRLSNLKNAMYRVLKKSKIDFTFRNEFCRLRKEYEFLKRFLYRQHLWSVESKIKKNSKAFWSFINTKKKSSGIPSTMSYNKVTSSDPSQICDFFASYFQSNFVLEDSDPEFLSEVSSTLDLGSLSISNEEILFELSSLEDSVCLAPDNIPPIFLKKLKSCFVIPLHLIFNLSLTEGVFLDCWKHSFISPIHKSGSKQAVENYRPIAKLQVIPKIFEAIVKKKIYALIKNFISEFQHGFVGGRSTATNLSIFTSYCLQSMETRNQVDVIFTDFAKAFDRVQHNVLICKLQGMGFHSNFLKWIRSYLINRTQSVKVGSISSKTINNYSGVPQGSHLGPLLFLIFINDLPSVILKAEKLLFADDFKIFMEVRDLQDCIQLQRDIESVTEWCSKHRLHLNTNKCSVMTFHRIKTPIIFDYTISNTSLKRLYLQKDLGVIFDPELKFNSHIDYIISRANAMLGFIMRNSKDFTDPYTFKSLYVALVRSVLEYCSVVWCPYHNTTIFRIERVQKKFTKFALRKLYSYPQMPSYETRCQLIGLKPLDKRRSYYLTMFAHDVISGHIDCSTLLSSFGFYAPQRCLRPRENEFFSIPRHYTNYGQNNPITNSCFYFNQNFHLIDFNINREFCKATILNSL